MCVDPPARNAHHDVALGPAKPHLSTMVGDGPLPLHCVCPELAPGASDPAGGLVLVLHVQGNPVPTVGPLVDPGSLSPLSYSSSMRYTAARGPGGWGGPMSLILGDPSALPSAAPAHA